RRHAGRRLRDDPRRVSDPRARHGRRARRGPKPRDGGARLRCAPLAALLEGGAARHRPHCPGGHAARHRLLPARRARGRDVRGRARAGLDRLAHGVMSAGRAQTDAGFVGAGYSFAVGARRARELAELVEGLAEVYVGRAPAPQARHAEGWRALNFIGHAGPSLLALAALDTACWDLAARAVNLPLFRFLGGDRTRVPTYASSGLWIDDSGDGRVREAEDF